MSCSCGRPLSVAWTVDGAVWRHAGVTYCSEGCARFRADAFGAPPVKEIRR